MTSPTAQEVFDRLREEWDALGLLSYGRGGDGAPWMADLTKDDVECLRGLLRDAAAALGGLREQLAESEAANESYAAEAKMARQALREIADRHPDAARGEHPAVDIARAALGPLLNAEGNR